MFCDAAKTGGLGYVLTQKKPEGNEYNIIYAGSTGLTELQKRTWSMGELELRAVVFGLQNACYFTYGSPHITIHTNHAPLVGMSKKPLDKLENPPYIKMFEKMSTFNYTLRHISGELNIPADILSRLPDKNKDLPDISAHVPLKSVEAVQTRSSSIKITRDLIMMAACAKEDTNYQDLINKLKEGTDPNDIEEGDLDEYKPAWKDLKVVDTEGGHLFYLDTLPVPPRSERKRLMETAHQQHMSHQTTFINQKRLWWWNTLKEDIYQ